MFSIIAKIVLTALTVLAIANFVPGIEVTNFYTALIVAVVWGIITLIVRPVLFLLTLPITLLTFGLFSFILNALLFWLTSSLVAGFTVEGFIPALIGSLLLSLVSWAVNRVL